MKSKIVLIHGFHRTKRDMEPLGRYLVKLGYISALINLPLTFKSIEEATEVLEGKMELLLQLLEQNEKINLVGHSTGGLIIRHYLAVTKHLDKINRCVQIATPNKGYKLADMAEEVSKFYVNTYKTLKSLQTTNVNSLTMEQGNEVEIGAIAGNKCNKVLGRLLENENDGRVEVEAVKYEGLKDFIVLPYDHMDIHKQPETAVLIDRFLKTGQFEKIRDDI